METFITEYAKCLAHCVETMPQEYAYPPSVVPNVVARMKVAIGQGTYNKDGAAFKLTCKNLGIKYTYKAIKEFIACNP